MGKNQNMEPVDVNQAWVRSFDGKEDAMRVVIVNDDKIDINVNPVQQETKKEIQIERIEVPVIVKEQQIERIEIPVVVKETVIEKIEVPVISQKVEYIEKPIVVKEIVEIEKPVIVKEPMPFKMPKLVEAMIVAQTISLLGIFLVVFYKLVL